MNDIDRAVRTKICAMIGGQRVWLTAEDQRSIAAWAAKTATVLRYTHSPTDPVPQDWLDHLYQRHEAPNTWHIWLGVYNGSEPVIYSGRDISVIFDSAKDATPPENTAHGVSMTLVLGYLAIKVLGIKEGAPDHEPDSSTLLKILPTTGGNLDWPPESHGDDQTIHLMINWMTEQQGQPS
jgi:hypothetical protein